jgi:hypothetical protein
MFFPHLANYIFLIFSTNEPELGSWHRFDINHFHLEFWIRQDSYPQPLDHESSSLTTRQDLRPKKIFNSYFEFFTDY